MTITGAFLHTPGVHNQTVFGLKVCSLGKCSAPYILGMNNDFITRDYFQVWGEKAGTIKETLTPCFKSFREFCDEPGLVAYAPYENSVEMYDSGGTVFSSLSGALTSSNYKLYNAASGTFLDSTGAVVSFADSNLAGAWDAVGLVERPFVPLDIYKWGRAGTGIFLDNDLNDDELKYNLTPLNLTGSFSIEMSVRGAALKRDSVGTTMIYYLLDSGLVYLDIYDGSFNQPVMYLGYNLAGFHNVEKIDIGGISPAQLIDNEFYKIRADFNGTSWNLQIRNKDNILIAQSINTGTSGISANLNTNVFIGSDTSNSYQWNDIFNYTKAYKY